MAEPNQAGKKECPIILHISSDYPDPIKPNKTIAVYNLVEGTPEYRHVVYSLNRENGWSGITAEPFGQDRVAVRYKAPPKGLFWGSRLKNVAGWIGEDLKKKNIIPDLVEAHKFTVEGLIGQDLAREFSCPLVCDIQGGTDTKILRIKLGLRRRYRQIAQESSLFFPYAPWSIEPFEKLAGLERGKCRCLPVTPDLDNLQPANPVDKNRLLSVFHLDGWKHKNFTGLIRAVKKLSAQNDNIKLDVYGGGKPETLAAMENLIKRYDVQNHVHLRGSVSNNELPEIMKNYTAFVLPSLVESYGLVYVEALFSGLPILFSKGRGIDGYMDEKSIGYACNPRSVEDIADGIDYLIQNQRELKTGIANLQTEGSLDILRRENILNVYRAGINAVLAEKK